MTAKFSCDEIIDIVQGRLATGFSPDQSGAVATDTRNLQAGEWYLALAGARFDGHDFLGEAFARGAIGAIVAERPAYPISNPQFALIAVEDTLAAYHALARYWRRRINPFVLAVTGSSGKTTTKEMCAGVLESTLRVHKSKANENNEIGVPKTILSMPDQCQALVLEMAMRGLGQIDQLARCALPDVGIITNAGTAHLELLGSVERIAQAKCELLANLPANGEGIIGAPSDYLLAEARRVFRGKLSVCQVDSIEIVAVTAEKTHFRVKGSQTEFIVHAHGRPLLEDAWCAITAARLAGVSDDNIQAGLARFHPVTGRGNRIHLANDILIIDETYNANPDSVRASVSAMLDACSSSKQKLVVLGDLAELGGSEKELHYELGEWLKDKPISALVTIGPLSAHLAQGANGAAYPIVACADQQQAEVAIRERLLASTCILIKGSRRAGLDKLVDSLASQNALPSS